jgi:outer membrane receptor for ferrienterochelin and colicin
MTRTEEIEKKAHQVSYNTDEYESFIFGAEWADETMIDKVCKWLYKNTYKHVDDSRVSMIFEHTIDMIENFRKAMEE